MSPVISPVVRVHISTADPDPVSWSISAGRALGQVCLWTQLYAVKKNAHFLALERFQIPNITRK